MSQITNKSYYAILPANVRYDKKLTPGAKLLYAEITALCNEKGFSWATNDYFEKLYNVNDRTIQRWLKDLKNENYIYIENLNNKRFIYIQSNTTKMSQGGRQKCRGGVTKMSHRILKKNIIKEYKGNIKENNDVDIIKIANYDWTN